MVYLKAKKGFTLSEVLITLTVLGIIAIIVVPNLIRNYQKRLTVTKLQKAYANLENMAQNIAVYFGCIPGDVSCTGLSDDFDSDKFIEASGMKVIDTKTKINRALYLYCENSNSNCNNTYGVYFQPANKLYIAKDNIGYIVKSTTIRTFDERINGSRVIQQDKGFLVFVFTDPKSDIIYNWKRLRLGKNVFLFTIYDNFEVEPAVANSEAAIYPLSKKVNFADYSCDKTNTKVISGYGCAAKILHDGWKINY